MLALFLISFFSRPSRGHGSEPSGCAFCPCAILMFVKVRTGFENCLKSKGEYRSGDLTASRFKQHATSSAVSQSGSQSETVDDQYIYRELSSLYLKLMRLFF